jgi:hypothetical protein
MELQPNPTPNWNANNNNLRRGFSLGGTATFGAFSVTLDVTRDTKNEWYLPISTKKFTNELLDLRYAFSKRTFMYAMYLHEDGTNTYGIGVRHNF